MLSWFVPRQAKFFDMFRESADIFVLGAKELIALTTDLPNVEKRARNIKELESKADVVTHRTIEELHKTFITPLDREEIYRLITKMDDVMDYIEAVAERFQLYDIKAVTPEIHQLAQIILQSAEAVRFTVTSLENMKNSALIIEKCIEINRLENEADHVLRMGMGKLFREDVGYKDLIKFKEIYELMETVTDRCEDVANIVESIVMENA